MKIIVADFIYTPHGYIKDMAVAFEENIVEIDSASKLREAFPKSKLIYMPKNSIIYPGFINTHVHLEFSNNKTTLSYGSFVPWLKSVMQNLSMIQKCSKNDMKNATLQMLKSGITSFGAISSSGNDLKTCLKTPQRVLFFNEVVGSSKEKAETIWSDFEKRVKKSQKYSSKKFIPAVAIHSPYATHPLLVQKTISLAKQQVLPLTAHLLESKAEKEWIEKNSGEFKAFYAHMSIENSVNSKDDFLSAFDDIPTHFVHLANASKEDLEYLKAKNHSIAHCPRSNRLLGCGVLDIAKVDCKWSVATDGLSSNWSLNIFDELRAALMMHSKQDIATLADELIKSITQTPSCIFGLNCGEIAKGKNADFAIITLPDKPNGEDDISLLSIIHTKKAKQVYIGGKRYV